MKNNSNWTEECHSFKSRFDYTEERTSNREDRKFEIPKSEEQEEKEMKMSEESWQELWGTMKRNKSHMRIPEGEERDRKGLRVYLNQKHLKTSEKNGYFFWGQKATNRLNPKRTTTRRIILKLSNVKDNERILRAERGKRGVTDKESPDGYRWIFQQKLFRPGENAITHSRHWKEITANQGSHTWRHCLSEMKESRLSWTNKG